MSNVVPMYPAFKSKFSVQPSDLYGLPVLSFGSSRIWAETQLKPTYFLVPPCRDLGLLPQHPAEEVRNCLQRRYRGDGSRVWLQLRRAVWHMAADPAVSSWVVHVPSCSSVCLCIISPAPVLPFSQSFLCLPILIFGSCLFGKWISSEVSFLGNQSLVLIEGQTPGLLPRISPQSFLWLWYYLALGKRFSLISRLMDLIWSY